MGGWVDELVGREVDPHNAAALVADHDPERIAQAVEYFDALPSGGPGLLVRAIQEGRKPRAKRSVADSQQAYGEEIVAWLREHFPQYNRDQGNRTHAAAITCVIRLHHKHGRHLSVAEHGPTIRAAVTAWEHEYGGEQ